MWQLRKTLLKRTGQKTAGTWGTCSPNNSLKTNFFDVYGRFSMETSEVSKKCLGVSFVGIRGTHCANSSLWKFRNGSKNTHKSWGKKVVRSSSSCFIFLQVDQPINPSAIIKISPWMQPLEIVWWDSPIGIHPLYLGLSFTSTTSTHMGSFHHQPKHMPKVKATTPSKIDHRFAIVLHHLIFFLDPSPQKKI